MESTAGRAGVTQNDSTASQRELGQQVSRQHVAVRPDPGYWFLLLCGAVMSAGYVAVFMQTLRASYTESAAAQPALLLMPVIVFAALADGARERFGSGTVRDVRKTALVALVVIATFALVYLFAVWQGINGNLARNVLVPLALFGVVAFEPIMALTKERSYRHEAVSEPRGRKARRVYLRPQQLSAAVKRNTVMIGVIFAAMLVSSPFTMVAAYVHLGAMVCVLAMLVLQRSPGNIARAGYEWGEAQWSVFSVAVASHAVAAMLVQYGHLLFTRVTVIVIDVVLGALTLVLCMVATVLPGARRR